MLRSSRSPRPKGRNQRVQTTGASPPFRVWLMGAATSPLNQPKALSSPQRLRSYPLNQPSQSVRLDTTYRPYEAYTLSQQHTIPTKAQPRSPVNFAALLAEPP